MWRPVADLGRRPPVLYPKTGQRRGTDGARRLCRGTAAWMVFLALTRTAPVQVWPVALVVGFAAYVSRLLLGIGLPAVVIEVLVVCQVLPAAPESLNRVVSTSLAAAAAQRRGGHRQRGC